MRRRFVSIVVAVAALASAASAAEIAGTEWTLEGRFVSAVARVGTYSVKSDYTAYFGPLSERGLEAGEWLIVDPQGDSTWGTYAEDPRRPGKGLYVLTHDESARDDYLRDKIYASTDDYPDLQVENVDVTREKFQMIVRTTRKGTTLSLKGQIQADVDAMVYSMPYSTRMKVIVTAKGTQENQGGEQGGEQAGSAWACGGLGTFRVSGAGALRYDMDVEIFLGPDEQRGLAAGEWMARDEEDGTYFYGTYALDRNRITIYGMEDSYEQQIWEMVGDALESDGVSYYDVDEIDVTDYSVTGTIKPGKRIVWNVKVRFEGAAWVEGSYETGRGTLTERFVGVPLN